MRHLVYGSAGFGQAGTGVPSWESKVHVERHLRELGVPFTILRPVAFMELMSEASFYPAVGTWSIWPRLTGEERPIYWLAIDDLGAIAAIAFADREGAAIAPHAAVALRPFHPQGPHRHVALAAHS